VGRFWDDIDEIERPSDFHQKTTFTISSMAQGNTILRFFQRDKKGMARTL
jgi:hypothetical protein